MNQDQTKSRFDARLLRPRGQGNRESWAFVILPKDASENLPRRGRTTIEGTINGCKFQALLEPDGLKSHWLRIDESLLERSNTEAGVVAHFEIMAVEQEPEPEVPADLGHALEAEPEAMATWQRTTTIARIDWIHWVSSAKQEKTRAKRIKDACYKLASGEKRVCCFDPSGFYSKAFKAPEAED